MAFQPLPGKPKNVIVAMGDSYSSGEGASEGDRDYYPETNYRGKNKKIDENDPSRDGCHRSTYAWSRQASLPGASKSIGALDDGSDNNMDYHLIACSGARTYNVLRNPLSGELPQIQKGYLNNNTTLVTISIGGNDARFASIVQQCLVAAGGNSCETKSFDDLDAAVEGRDAKFQGQPLSTAVPGVIKEIVRPDITQTLMTIHQKAPYVKIILMGYPHLISNSGSCLRMDFPTVPPVPPLPSLGMSAPSAAWLNGIADVLTAAMQGAKDDAKTAGAPVEFSDPTNDFAGKGICGDPEQVHGIVTALTKSDQPKWDLKFLGAYGLSNQSFHPKIGGARLYANSLERTMTGMGL
ncbi:SGNH/GDSL hydrolase family protein [Streptomyces sp. NPDC006711]|uniref:SGNH/GDSL hydrolase family protein n=1 Tax=Streptomyces sp. NPDC006711 TaxID=3364762 RepID=UPI003695F966